MIECIFDISGNTAQIINDDSATVIKKIFSEGNVIIKDISKETEGDNEIYNLILNTDDDTVEHIGTINVRAIKKNCIIQERFFFAKYPTIIEPQQTEFEGQVGSKKLEINEITDAKGDDRYKYRIVSKNENGNGCSFNAEFYISGKTDTEYQIVSEDNTYFSIVTNYYDFLDIKPWSYDYKVKMVLSNSAVDKVEKTIEITKPEDGQAKPYKWPMWLTEISYYSINDEEVHTVKYNEDILIPDDAVNFVNKINIYLNTRPEISTDNDYCNDDFDYDKPLQIKIDVPCNIINVDDHEYITSSKIDSNTFNVQLLNFEKGRDKYTMKLYSPSSNVFTINFIIDSVELLNYLIEKSHSE